MSNATEEQKFERRRMVAELFASGTRSINKIAARLGCTNATVRKDLVILRKKSKETGIDPQRLNEIRNLCFEGLMADIAEINEMIDQVRGESPDLNSLAISRLYKSKLSARYQVAQLFGFIKDGVVSINVPTGGEGEPGPAKKSEAEAIPEEDLDKVGKSLFT